MELHVGTRSSRIYGGHTTFDLAGQFLQEGLGEYGASVREIEIMACFRGGKVGDSSLQRRYDEFHSVFLPTLPKVTFLRKKARLDLIYETKTADASFLERPGFLSVDMFSQVVHELAETLHLIDPRLKKSDDFDVARFHSDIAALVDSVPQSEDELQTLKEKMDNIVAARNFAMDPWDRLGIEWDDFHPAARTLLDEPFFWDCVDDNSPHGNDTGADLLSDFERWNKKHPHLPAFKMARRLFEEWDIAPIDYRVVDKATVEAVYKNDPIALVVTDEALIAVAFAAVKLRGCCDSETREFALRAIERERLSAVIIGRGWRDMTERVEALDFMATYLMRMPESQS